MSQKILGSSGGGALAASAEEVGTECSRDVATAEAAAGNELDAFMVAYLLQSDEGDEIRRYERRGVGCTRAPLCARPVPEAWETRDAEIHTWLPAGELNATAVFRECW